MDFSQTISVTKLRVLEAVTLTSVISDFLCDILWRDSLLTVIPSFIFLSCAIIFLLLLYFIIFFKVVLRQFRSCIIFTSVCIVVIIDFVTVAMFNQHLSTNDWITTFIGSVVWFFAVTLILMADCIFPKLSNVSRFMLPVVAVAIASYNIYLSFGHVDDDNIITFRYGTMTIRSIQRIAYAQIIWFCGTLMFRVFIDPYHQNYQFIDFPVIRSETIKFDDDDYEVSSIFNGKFSFKTKYIFIIVFIWMIVVDILYFLSNYFLDVTIIQYIIWALISLFTIIGLISFMVLYANHFERELCKSLLRQFRFYLFIVSIFVLSGCVIYHSISYNITHNQHFHVGDVLTDLAFLLNFVLFVSIFVLCDGLKCEVPYWFMFFACVNVWMFTFYSIYLHTFEEGVTLHPVISMFIEKEAIIQLWLLITLISYYYIVTDSKHIKFAFIRQKVKRTTNYCEIVYKSDNIQETVDLSYSSHTNQNHDKGIKLLQEYDTRKSMEMNSIRFSVHTISSSNHPIATSNYL